MTTNGKVINIAAACAQTLKEKHGINASLLELVPFIEQAYETGHENALQRELQLETTNTPEPEAIRAEELEHIERYRAAAHAVQTGIAFAKDKTDQTPKHLRTGIDLSKTDMAGLVGLLIDKGILTHLEYYKAIADAAEIEVKSRAEAIGPNVTLV